MNWKIKGAIIGLLLFILTYVLYIYNLGIVVWPLAMLFVFSPSLVFTGIIFVGAGFFIGWLVDSIRDKTPAFTCFVISLTSAFGVLVSSTYAGTSLLDPVYIIWTIIALIIPNLISWLYAKLVGKSAIEDVTKGFFVGLITGIVFALALLVYAIYFTITTAYVYGYGTAPNVQYGISGELLYSLFIQPGALLWIAALVVPVAIASLIGWIVGKIRG
jgi:hypothetical protein